jgi:hypothetical protein
VTVSITGMSCHIVPFILLVYKSIGLLTTQLCLRVTNFSSVISFILYTVYKCMVGLHGVRIHLDSIFGSCLTSKTEYTEVGQLPKSKCPFVFLKSAANGKWLSEMPNKEDNFKIPNRIKRATPRHRTD